MTDGRIERDYRSWFMLVFSAVFIVGFGLVPAHKPLIASAFLVASVSGLIATYLLLVEGESDAE